MKRVLITGAGGQLATEYQFSKPKEGWDYVFLSRKDLDISKHEKVENFFSNEKFDVVINMAAYTDVEKAEKIETEKCFNANALGPKILAKICKANNIPLIHISTDYVFDGKKETYYTELDRENPLNDYGRTKFVGEKFIQQYCDWYYILRVSWVYSNHSKNFFTTMLSLSQERTELNVIEDQYGSPTSTKEICRAIDGILDNLDPSLSGVYHFSGIGKTSWKNFAEEIFSQCKIAIKVNGIPSSSWQSKVSRPANSYMSSDKITKNFNIRPWHWKTALTEIVSDRKIIPIKVGDNVTSGDVTYIIVSTDWLKRIAKLSPINDITKIIELPFDVLTANEK